MKKQLKFILSLGVVGMLALSCQKNVNVQSTQSGGLAAKLNVNGLPSVPSEGANYNEGYSEIDYDELSRSNTVWVRGILNFFHYYYRWKDPNTSATWANDADMNAFLAIQGHGYKTAVNIRFNFVSYGIPVPPKSTNPNSDFRQMLDSFLPVFLATVMPKTDIIVIGNEPFIETAAGDQGTPLMDFYAKAATRTNTYKTNQGVSTPLFIGAFDNVYDHLSDSQTAHRSALLQFAHDSAWVSGADVHIHCHNMTELNTSMSTIASGLRNTSHPMGGQQIIVTEFSLKKLFQDHETDNLPANFASDYSLPAGVTKVWQYINLAATTPRPLAEWNDWNLRTSWLESNKHWIRDSFDQMDNYPKFILANTAIHQGAISSFGADTPPWILNPIYVNETVVHKLDGTPNVRYGYFDDYVALHH